MYELKKVAVRLKLKEEPGLYSTTSFSTPETAVKEMKEVMEEYDTETVCIINLDTKMRPINYSIISIGDINASLVPIKNVFKAALLSNATSFIILHNHPSGDPTPSGEDITVTKKLREAGDLMEIKLLDHIIVGNGNYYSFAEMGV